MGEESFRLGRIGGIRVGVNWSVLVVFWLISWSLAAVVLPRQAPGRPSSVYCAAGLATAALFFASLLAHELGHAFVARRAGRRVEGITLWLFGGVARLRGEAENPGAELRIAGVGPLVSLAVAAVSGLLALGADVVGASPLLVAALAWLAWINGMLALFNLIPAAPLDGGRVLRAVAWRRTGDRLRATTIAARAGRVFGYVLIGLGLVRFAFQGNFGGLWLVFLGWFLLSAARAEETSARLREALAGIRVRDVMTPDPVVGPGWYTVDAFLEEFVLRHRCSAFPVRSFDGDLVGLVPLARLKRVPADQRARTRVSDVACPLAEVPVATRTSCCSTCCHAWRGAVTAARW
jgi:Zn-dependent protease